MFHSSVLKTPQILELSGVGDPSLLNSLGIKTNVDLPGVGTMVQDHIFTHLCWGAYNNIVSNISHCRPLNINPHRNWLQGVVWDYRPSSWSRICCWADEAPVSKILVMDFLYLTTDSAQGKGMFNMAMSSTASLPFNAIVSDATYQEILAKQQKSIDARSSSLSLGLKKQYDTQMDILREDSSADCEYVSYPGYFPPQGMLSYFLSCCDCLVFSQHYRLPMLERNIRRLVWCIVILSPVGLLYVDGKKVSADLIEILAYNISRSHC